MNVKVSNQMLRYHYRTYLLITMEGGMSFDNIYDVLMTRRLEIIKWFLVRVDTVPEILTGLRVAGIIPDQDVLHIKSKILDDVTGVSFAGATFDWMMNYLKSHGGIDNKVFVSKLLTSYATIARHHMRLHTAYQERGIDYTILQLL